MRRLVCGSMSLALFACSGTNSHSVEPNPTDSAPVEQGSIDKQASGLKSEANRSCQTNATNDPVLKQACN
jgi:hypothetical protein